MTGHAGQARQAPTAAGRAHLIAVVSAVIFLRWLAVGHVTMAVSGVTVTVPALAIAAVTVLAVAGAVVAVVVYRLRAERARLAAWRARKPGAR